MATPFEEALFQALGSLPQTPAPSGSARVMSNVGRGPSLEGSTPLFNGVPLSGRVPVDFGLPLPVVPPITYDPYQGYVGSPGGVDATGGAGPGVEGPGTPGDTSIGGRQTLADAMSGARVGVGPVGINVPTTLDQGIFSGARLAFGAVPIVGPLFSALLSLAGRQNASALAGQTAAAFGQQSANPAFQAQRAGERSGSSDPTQGVDLNNPDISTGLGLMGLLSSSDIPSVPVSTTITEPGTPSVTAPTGQVGLTAQGGLIGGVGGAPGGMANVANPNTGPVSNVVEAAPTGSPGGSTGVAGPSSGTGSVSAGLTAGEVGIAGQGLSNDGISGDTGDGGGGGGGAGGGGCFLATFGMEALNVRERQRAQRFFGDFHRLYMRSNPDTGPQLFRKYQVIARQIIAKIKAAKTEKAEQKFIYTKLIKPTGSFIEKKEVPEAVRNLTSVVTTLAKKYNVPIPTRATSETQ